MNQVVFRTCTGVKNKNGTKAYHSNPDCAWLKLARSVRKTKLGAVVAGGFHKHC